MASSLSRLLILCAASAALCLAVGAFAARPTEQSQAAKDDAASGEQSEQVVEVEPVEFATLAGPNHVVKTVQPGGLIEVHLRYSAGTPFQWELLGGTTKDFPIPTDEPLETKDMNLQPVGDIGVKTSEISGFYSYLDDPKFERGFTGGPMTSKCTITAPEKPGVYRVVFGNVSFVDKDFPPDLRVVEIHVEDQQ